MRLNRRTAPTIYRGILAVTRESDGSIALAGSGTAIDWVVAMNRFPQEALLINWHRAAPLIWNSCRRLLW